MFAYLRKRHTTRPQTPVACLLNRISDIKNMTFQILVCGVYVGEVWAIYFGGWVITEEIHWTLGEATTAKDLA